MGCWLAYNQLSIVVALYKKVLPTHLTLIGINKLIYVTAAVIAQK